MIVSPACGYDASCLGKEDPSPWQSLCNKYRPLYLPKNLHRSGHTGELCTWTKLNVIFKHTA